MKHDGAASSFTTIKLKKPHQIRRNWSSRIRTMRIVQAVLLIFVIYGWASAEGEDTTSAGLMEYEVFVNDRPSTLTVHENTTLAAAAGEFCQVVERMEGQSSECVYLLTEALMRQQGGQALVPPLSASARREHPVDEILEGLTQLRARQLAEFHAGRGVLLFVHLKKCGGMTLQKEVLEPAFASVSITHIPEEMRWFFNHGHEAMSRWSRELSGARVVADHIPFGFHALIAPRPFVYVTVLREPRSRIVSYYEYLRIATDWEYPCMSPNDVQGESPRRSMCKNNWWPAGLPRNASIAEWLERQLIDGHYVRAHIDNYQTRMICGPTAMKQASPAGEETLLCAKAALRGYFEVVGLTKRLDETACLFYATLGLAEEGVKDLPRVNSNDAAARAEEEAALIASIPDFYTRLDTELYRFAQHLMEEKLDQYPQCRRHGEQPQYQQRPETATM